MKRNIGLIKICWSYFEDNQLFNDIIKPLSEKIVVIETKHDLLSDEITYKCFCDDFDVIELGEIVPEYKVIFSSDNLEPFKITFERKE